MTKLADGFIALPAGFGTFEELCEIVTRAQLGFHSKPCGLLNIGGFYDNLIAMFDFATYENFIREEHRKLVLIESVIAKLYEQMKDYSPPLIQKWLDKEST